MNHQNKLSIVNCPLSIGIPSSCGRTERINAENTLDFSLSLRNPAWRYIKIGSVVELDGDFFDVAAYNKQLPEGGQRVISVSCEHVSYRLNDAVYDIKEYWQNDTPGAILRRLLEGTPFTVGAVEPSGIVTLESTGASRRALVVMLAALAGGELLYEGFTVSLMTRRGAQTPRVLKTGRDILVLDERAERVGPAEAGGVTYSCDALKAWDLGLGDAVRLDCPDLDIDAALRVTGLSYDPFNPRRKSIEIGDNPAPLENEFYTMTKDIDYAKKREFSGTITTELITNNLYALNGDIANLTVDRLRIISIRAMAIMHYLQGDTSDLHYQYIHGIDHEYIEARTEGAETQAKNLDGQPLYWLDGIGGHMTVESDQHEENIVLLDRDGDPILDRDGNEIFLGDPVIVGGIPVMVYQYEEIISKVVGFREVSGDWGSAQSVIEQHGRGDGSGRKIAYTGKFDGDHYWIKWLHSDGEEYFIKIGETGITFYPELSGGHTVIDAAGEALPQQPKLQIIGAALADDPVNNTTKVTVAGGGHMILDRQPVLADLDNLPEDGVILVYDPNQPYNAQ